MNKTISITINGTLYERTIPIRTLLVDFIRYEASLTGTHVGCTFEGKCGACTVHLDDDAIKSCLMLAVQCHGRSITTVEGVADGAELHPLQKAFNECHALQCGYCTSGMLMVGLDLIKKQPELNDEKVRQGLVGNICRCAGYDNIVDAILRVAASGTEVGAPAGTSIK
jgi:aerobic-type carbon monoxide dehydrogenase small subunit (CoxS/CutS family)